MLALIFLRNIFILSVDIDSLLFRVLRALICLRLLPVVVLDRLVKLLLKVVFELPQDLELPQDGMRPRAAVVSG